MALSMTGYANLERASAYGRLQIELRSVNHRYLELHFKLDDNLRPLEPLLREILSTHLQRGKVECKIHVIPNLQDTTSLNLNQTLLQQLHHVQDQVRSQFAESCPLSVGDILRWPGMLEGQKADSDSPDINGLSDDITSALLEVAANLTETRAREGAKLAESMLEKLSQMEALVMQLRPILPSLVQNYQQKLQKKLQEALVQVDQDRLSQEVVLFAQRIDIDEELQRLCAHFGELRRILNDEPAAGKRLDFLMQELNREANTLGSKSVSTETTQTAMQLKVLIEQIREQVQNIE